MNFQQFGNVKIFRPSYETERFIAKRGKAHLVSRFAVGEYHGRKEVNAIIQHQFKFYEQMLSIVIPKLASRGAAEFLLSQYDEAWKLLHGRGIFDQEERQQWEYIEPIFKRAIKFLVEQICLRASDVPERLSKDEALFAMETAVVCAESMVHLSQESDSAFSVFPDHCVVRIFDTGPLNFEVTLEGQYSGFARSFSDRIIRDRNSRDKFVGFPQFDYHTATHQKYLDDAFGSSFGMTYGEFIAAIRAVIEGCRAPLEQNSLPIVFVHHASVINELAKSNRSRSAIELAIKGFSVTPEHLTADKRVIWNSKQESRAYRRGFFVFPHESGPHLAFSRAMAKENLLHLVFWICFKHLPIEWRTEETTKALGSLASAASNWFELVVSQNLQSLGIVGQRMHRTIGQRGVQIRIPDMVGEFDFLGYHAEQQLLVIAEAKMVMTGLEARYWRDDLDEFVFGTGSYAERFRRKISWVVENRKAISAALGFNAPVRVGAVMLTLYPCVAREFISDFPCVSITEFMLDYNSKCRWPYPLI